MADIQPSRMALPSSFLFGTPGAITITAYATGVAHKITYSFMGSTGTALEPTTSTSVSWTPPLELLAQIPNRVSGTGVLTLHTFAGSEEIGSREYAFTAIAPASVKPSTSVSVADSAAHLTLYGGAIQNVTRLSIHGSASALYGATIVRQTITAAGLTYEGAEALTEPVRGTESITVTFTATDSRGLTASSTRTVNVIEYTQPRVTPNVYRCSAAGAAKPDGANIRIRATSSITDLGGRNTVEWAVRYKKTTESEWTSLTGSGTSYASAVIPAELDASYDVEVTASDLFTTVTRAAVIPSGNIIADVPASGKGVTFGRTATGDGFVVGMPAALEQGASLGGTAVLSLLDGNDLPNLPTGFSGNGRALVLTDEPVIYLLADSTRRLWVGTALTLGASITWAEK